MLVTAEYQRAKATPDTLPATQAQAGKWGKQMFPFRGTLTTGYYSPPFVWQHIEQDRGTAWKALDLRANLIAGLEYKAFKRMPGGKRKEVMYDHFAANLLRNPGGPAGFTYRTRSEIFRLIEKWSVIAGNAYCLGWQATDGPYKGLPVSLWPMEANNITVLPTQGEQFLPGYRYTTPRGVFFYQPDQVWHVRRSEPTPYFVWNLYFGQPEYGKYGNVIDTETKALLSQDTYFDRNGVPAMVYRTPYSPDGDESYEANVQLFKEQQAEEYYGARNAGKDMVLPPGWEAQLLDGGKREVNWLQTMVALREYISTCEGVPKILLDGSFNTRASADIVTENVLKHTIFPDAKMICESLTVYLQNFESDLEVDFVDPVLAPIEDRINIVNVLKTIPGAVNGNMAGRILMHDNWEDTKEGEAFTATQGVVMFDAVVSGATMPPPPPEPSMPATEPPVKSPGTTKAWVAIPEHSHARLAAAPEDSTGRQYVRVRFHDGQEIDSVSNGTQVEVPEGYEGIAIADVTPKAKEWVELPADIQKQFLLVPEFIKANQPVTVVFANGIQEECCCDQGRQVLVLEEHKSLRIVEVRLKK